MSWAIKVRCIDDVQLACLPLKRFDGADWSQAAAELQAACKPGV
jgi:hypothetical protein